MLEENKNDNDELENYGVWVKSGPENYVDTKNTPAENDFELTDLESNPDNFLLTEEEENLLDSLEKDVKSKENEDDGDFFNMQEVDSLDFEDEDEENNEDDSIEIDSTPEADTSLDEEEFIDIDIPKTIDIDGADYSKTSGKADAKSVEIISKIAADLKNDLSVIKNELFELKKELSKYKKVEETEIGEEEQEQGDEKEISSGFFSDDGDETIALTGDELDNLFNTAEITEESSSSDKKAKITDTAEKKTDIELLDIEDSFETQESGEIGLEDELSVKDLDIELEQPEIDSIELDKETEPEIEIDNTTIEIEEEVNINDLPEIKDDDLELTDLDTKTIDETIEIEEQDLIIEEPQLDETPVIEEQDLIIEEPQEDEIPAIGGEEPTIEMPEDEIEIEEQEFTIEETQEDDIPAIGGEEPTIEMPEDEIEIEEQEFIIEEPQEDEISAIGGEELTIEMPEDEIAIEEEHDLTIEMPQEDEIIEIEEQALTIEEPKEIQDEIILTESAYEENKDELNFLDGKIDETPEKPTAKRNIKKVEEEIVFSDVPSADDDKKEITEEDFEEISLDTLDEEEIRDAEEELTIDDISIEEEPLKEVVEEAFLEPKTVAKKSVPAEVSDEIEEVSDETGEPEITLEEESAVDEDDIVKVKKQEKADTKKKTAAPEKSKGRQKESNDSARPVKKEVKAQKGGAIDNIPDNLKTEIKSVLVYLDQLLEALPDKKIDEFAKSEHFKTYKKLFEELGLM
ncbi:MAG: hypothetical protein FWE72_04525 [Spirochaetaceae bacterium]|nr:hypothetical protein [Spirochaetaceae bacterium]